MGDVDDKGYGRWTFKGDFAELILPEQYAKPIQRDEATAVRKAIGRLWFRACMGKNPEDEDDGVHRFAVSLRDVMTQADRRYEDSPLGTLDLGVFFHDWDERMAEVFDAPGTSAEGIPILVDSAAAERFAALSEPRIVFEVGRSAPGAIKTQVTDEQVDSNAFPALPTIPKRAED